MCAAHILIHTFRSLYGIGTFELMPIVVIAVIGVTLVASAIIALTVRKLANGIVGMIQSILNMAASETVSKGFEEARSQRVQVPEAQASRRAPAVRAMRCKSCGAVSKINAGQPEVCSYCDSPLADDFS